MVRKRQTQTTEYYKAQGCHHGDESDDLRADCDGFGDQEQMKMSLMLATKKEVQVQAAEGRKLNNPTIHLRKVSYKGQDAKTIYWTLGGKWCHVSLDYTKIVIFLVEAFEG